MNSNEPAKKTDIEIAAYRYPVKKNTDWAQTLLMVITSEYKQALLTIVHGILTELIVDDDLLLKE